MKPKNNYKPGGQDIMQTPPHAAELLFPLISKDWIIWESASGPERLLAGAFNDAGYEVIMSDIIDDPRYDFLAGYDPRYDEELLKLASDLGNWTIQVTNPPFSLKYAWLKRSFELERPFALLVPYETTFAAEFKVLAAQYHNEPWAIQKIVPMRRFSFKTPNYGWGKLVYDEKKDKMVMRGDSAQMPTAWITWGLAAEDEYPSIFDVYHAPTRLVKYNDDNTEKER